MPSTLRSAFSQLLSQGELPTLPRSGGPSSTPLLGASRVANGPERGRTGGVDRVARTGTTAREGGGRRRESSGVDEGLKKKKVASHDRDSIGLIQDKGGNHGVTSNVASKNLFDSDDDELVEAVDTDDGRRVSVDSERRHHRFQSIDVDLEDDGAGNEDLASQVREENRDNISCIKLSEGESTSYLGKRSRRGGGGGTDLDTQRSTTSTRTSSSHTLQQQEPQTSPTAIFARRKEEVEDQGRNVTSGGDAKERRKNTSRENRENSCSSSAYGVPPSCHSEEEEEAEGDDVLKILIATDTHLGYKADDNVRGGDSFETFEEILQIGRKLNVDFLLHGGDLFDDNKPSRTTLYRTICLLRQYCLGDGPINFEVLAGATVDDVQSSSSDQAKRADNASQQGDFSSSSSQRVDGFRLGLNYMDGNVNVCMPIFAMHGNHDDPGEKSHLSPLDLLEAAHLINYFGRAEAADEIVVKPVLITKGQTKVGIYGVGWIRDSRLHRAFNNGKVRFLVPAGDPTAKDWFNIMVVHQNMYKGAFGGQPPKNCIHEQMLPEFLDLAIWGHEHDCHLDLRESAQRNFRVLQPGSSIATSLVAGEALPKHVFLLEIRGENYRVTPHRLHTVRPLIFEEIILSDLMGIRAPLTSSGPSSGTSSRLQSKKASSNRANFVQPAEDRDVWQALTDAVEDLLRVYAEEAKIERGRGGGRENVGRCERSQTGGNRGEEREEGGAEQGIGVKIDKDAGIGSERPEKADFELFCNYSSMPEQKKLPLVRLRVEHTGFSTISSSRFGAQFIGKVANPADMIHFFRKRKTHHHSGGPAERGTALPDLEIEEIAGGDDTSEIRDIIFHFLEDKNALDILPEPDLNVAVQDFVVKMDANAIATFVESSLQAARREAKEKLRSHVSNTEKKQGGHIETADVQALVMERTRNIREHRLLHGFDGGGASQAFSADLPVGTDATKSKEGFSCQPDARSGKLNQHPPGKSRDADVEGEDDFTSEALQGSAVEARSAVGRARTEALFEDERSSPEKEDDNDDVLFDSEPWSGGLAGGNRGGSGGSRRQVVGGLLTEARGTGTREGRKRGGRKGSETAGSPSSGGVRCRGRGRRGGTGVSGTRRTRTAQVGQVEEPMETDRSELVNQEEVSTLARNRLLREAAGRSQPIPAQAGSTPPGSGSQQAPRSQSDLRSFFASSQPKSIVGRPAVERPVCSERSSFVRPSRGNGSPSQSLFQSSKRGQSGPEAISGRGSDGSSLGGKQERGTQPHAGGDEGTPAAPLARAEAGSFMVNGRRTQADAGAVHEESMVEDDDEDDLFLSSLGRAADTTARKGDRRPFFSWARR
ncbi:mre11 dna-binding domain-containing protein [Cystoisospora suis]|uniref:Mre11 dna-binding domain-containing protein n=1 Tax=Cystoisospora suis TaxID=483139 RepID=A0A2C6LAN5_9APIC|nr:mre11 dna-binding domain-containing protein [Cystoisospora suis]